MADLTTSLSSFWALYFFLLSLSAARRASCLKQNYWLSGIFLRSTILLYHENNDLSGSIRFSGDTYLCLSASFFSSIVIPLSSSLSLSPVPGTDWAAWHRDFQPELYQYLRAWTPSGSSSSASSSCLLVSYRPRQSTTGGCSVPDGPDTTDVREASLKPPDLSLSRSHYAWIFLICLQCNGAPTITG